MRVDEKSVLSHQPGSIKMGGASIMDSVCLNKLRMNSGIW